MGAPHWQRQPERAGMTTVCYHFRRSKSWNGPGDWARLCGCRQVLHMSLDSSYDQWKETISFQASSCHVVGLQECRDGHRIR